MRILYEDLKEGLRVRVKHRRRGLSEEGIIEGAPDGALKLRAQKLVKKNNMTFEVERITLLNATDFDFDCEWDKDVIQSVKRREINLRRVRFEESGVITDFGTFHSDALSVQRFTIRVNAEEWSDIHNIPVRMSVERREALSLAFSDHYRLAFEISRALKQELFNLIDPENYDVELAWDKESETARLRIGNRDL